MQNRVAVFAHYDKDNIIDDYVIYYLEGLKKVCNEIIFVSDCNLNEKEVSKIKHLCSKIIFEKHGEYDFGSYKRGILLIENRLNKFDELLLANDSCYGPIHPFEYVFDKMENQKCDFWGLTKSKERNDVYYLGSYFINFRKNVFAHQVFLDFFKSITKLSSKDEIIGKYEVGLNKLLLKNGFKSASFAKKTNVMPLLSSLSFKLIKNISFPFIKVSLLRDNPFGDGQIYKWKNYCNNNFILMVEKHLARTAIKKHLNKKNTILPYFSYNLIHRNIFNISSKGGKVRIRVFFITIFSKDFSI